MVGQYKSQPLLVSQHIVPKHANKAGFSWPTRHRMTKTNVLLMLLSFIFIIVFFNGPLGDQ